MADDYPASIFISYQHADKALAKALQDGMERKGYFVWRDEAELRVGDSIVERVTAALDQIEFVAAIVSPSSVTSPWCQKELSLAMTGEIAQLGVQVIPLRVDATPMPASLKDKLYLDVSSEHVEAAISTLAASIESHIQPVRQIPPRRLRSFGAIRTPASSPAAPVRVVGIDRDNVGIPRNDGTSGSALYAVPLVLSRAPSIAWRATFEARWNQGLFSTMHRPGIARVTGDRIILDGTTVDEVAQHHLDTVRQAIAWANDDEVQARRAADEEQARRDKLRQQHEADAAAIIDRMRFDE
ncbi:MAG: toll/interleukin-1 receptor domain-containing protein [Burkholderiales bacterium]